MILTTIKRCGGGDNHIIDGDDDDDDDGGGDDDDDIDDGDDVMITFNLLVLADYSKTDLFVVYILTYIGMIKRVEYIICSKCVCTFE